MKLRPKNTQKYNAINQLKSLFIQLSLLAQEFYILYFKYAISRQKHEYKFLTHLLPMSEIWLRIIIGKSFLLKFCRFQVPQNRVDIITILLLWNVNRKLL